MIILAVVVLALFPALVVGAVDGVASTNFQLCILPGLGITREQDAGKQRADERTRTADLLIASDPSDVAGGARACKPRKSRGFSILSIAHYCGAVSPGG